MKSVGARRWDLPDSVAEALKPSRSLLATVAHMVEKGFLARVDGHDSGDREASHIAVI